MANESVFDYIDLAAKIAIPLSLGLATTYYNSEQASIHARENCIDLQMRLLSMICSDKDCSVSKTRGNELLGINSMIGDRCKDAQTPPAPEINEALVAAGKQSTDAGTSAKLQESGGTPKPTIVTTSALVSLAPQASANLQPAATINPRLYVQISDPNQRSAATQFIAHLKGSTLDGATLIPQGPEYVPNSHVTVDEIRCVKAADCKAATDLATYLGGILGTAVQVRDLSARYEHSPNARAGHYELWFGPGDITVAPASD